MANIKRIPTDMIQDRSTGQKLSESLTSINSSLADKANKKSNVIYLSDLVPSSNPVSDYAVTINNLFTSNPNGVRLIVDYNIPIATTILMQSNCILEGANKKITITLSANANRDMVNWNYAKKGVIRNLTFDGNKSNNTSGSGIVVGGVGGTTTAVDGSLIEDIDINNCVDDGLQVVYPIWVIQINRVRITYCNGYGLYNTGTDNFFNNIYVMWCGKTSAKPVGVWFYGGNNKVNNMKVIFSGLASTDNSVGIRISGERQQINNLESQENLNAGVYLYYLKGSTVSLLSDANADKVAHVNNPGISRGFGVKLNGCIDNNLNILSTNYCYSSGYYHDTELIIDIDNYRNDIAYKYQTGNIKTALMDVSLTPDNYNVVNGYGLFTYIKSLKTKKTNIITEPIPTSGSTYWTMSGTPAISNGVITTTASGHGVIRTISLTAGVTYLFRVDFTNMTGTWSFRLEEGTTYTSPTRYAFGGSYHLIYTPQANETRTMILRSSSATASITIGGIGLIDITNEYSTLKNYYGEGTIGKLLCTDGLGATITA